MTVLDFLTGALTDAGCLRPGQTPSGTMAQVARQKFADMVDNWSTNRLRLFYVPEALYVLSNGIGVYKIGPGAGAPPNFDTAPGVYVKPVFIQAASVVVGTARRWSLNLLTRPQWDLNQSKTLIDPDGPTDLFYDSNAPVATFNVAPMPNSAQQMYASQWNPLRAFVPGEEFLNMEDWYPLEYIRAMRSGLSIDLAATFGRPVNQDNVSTFQVSIGDIEKTNNAKLSGAFGISRTLEGPTKGDGSPVGGPQQ